MSARSRNWPAAGRPDVLNGVVKSGSHKALDDIRLAFDIRDSSDEMRYYREHFIKMN